MKLEVASDIPSIQPKAVAAMPTVAKKPGRIAVTIS